MITFTQGDTATLNLTAQDGTTGAPFDITGATFTSYILGPGGVVVSFPNSQHTIVTANLGQFTLALGTTDTAACNVGPNKDILTKIVQSGSTIYFRANGIVQVLPPVPLT